MRLVPLTLIPLPLPLLLLEQWTCSEPWGLAAELFLEAPPFPSLPSLKATCKEWTWLCSSVLGSESGAITVPWIRHCNLKFSPSGSPIYSGLIFCLTLPFQFHPPRNGTWLICTQWPQDPSLPYVVSTIRGYFLCIRSLDCFGIPSEIQTSWGEPYLWPFSGVLWVDEILVGRQYEQLSKLKLAMHVSSAMLCTSIHLS